MADSEQAQGTGDAAQPADSTTAQAGRTFTQDELNRQIEARLQRERAKYSDYDDLKNAATKLAEMEKAQLSERERLERSLKESQEQVAKLAGEVQTSRAMAAAASAGALYPDLVAAKIPAEALADERKLASAIKDLRTTYPALFGRPTGGADGGAGANGKPTGGGMNQWIRSSAGR